MNREIHVNRLFILVFSTLLALVAQGCLSRWAAIYGDGDRNVQPVGASVCADGYRMAGLIENGEFEGWLTRLDTAGEVEWSYEYGWPGVYDSFQSVKTADFVSGEVVVAGSSHSEDGHGGSDGWVLRVDADGNVIDGAFFGGEDNDYFNDITTTSDGGYLAVGTTSSFGADSLDVYVAKMDANFETIWEKRYGGPFEDRGYRIDEIEDPSSPGEPAFLISADTNSFGAGGTDWWILVLRDDGTVALQETYGFPNSQHEPNALQVTASDGSPDGFIVGGIMHLPEDSSDNAAVLRLDDDGGISWANSFGVAEGEGEIHSVARSASGDFLFGGWAQVPDDDGWMFEVDQDSATVLWSKNYGLHDSMTVFEGIGSVFSMGSMGIMATGWTASEEGYRAPLIFRTDTSGEVPGCSLITNRPVHAAPIDNIITMVPDYDDGPGGLSVGCKLDPRPMDFKRQKACPLDCLFYVDDDSLALAPDGSDWSSAFQSVQEAIDEASTEIADMGYCEVWTAEGTYNIYQSSPYDTVSLASDVHVYGGFDGESDIFSGRDWEENETILSGESEDDPSSRVYHVVTGADDAWLDGFYVERGYAMHETEGVNQIGGGMLNPGVSTVVRNCTFRENLAAMGAGVFNYGGSPVFDGCRFSSNGYDENFTTFYGGGMANYVLNGTIPPPRILDSEFGGNGARAGSAVANFNADSTSTTPWAAPFFVNALIHGNNSTGQGDLDGAVLNVGANAHPTFVHCTLAGNTGEEITGGMVNYQSDPMIRNSIFWGDLYPSQSEEISSDATSSPEVWYSDMQSVWTGIGDFNLSSNPDFPLGGYSLQAGSPCIDTAEDLSAYAWLLPYVNHDIADPPHPRPYGPGWDMGCYENQGE